MLLDKLIHDNLISILPSSICLLISAYSFSYCEGELLPRIQYCMEANNQREFSQLGGFTLTHDGLLLVADNEFPRTTQSHIHVFDARFPSRTFISSLPGLPSRLHGIVYHPHTQPPSSIRCRIESMI